VPDARVQAAIDNWAPRFTTNGVDPNDFRTTTARIERWDEWLDAWCETAEVHLALAEALANQRRLEEADSSLEAAVGVLPEGDAFPAAWRVHAAAARLAQRRRRGAGAREHWTRAADAVRALTASLASEPLGEALAETFRNAPAVLEVLSHAAAKPSKAS